MLKFNRLKLTLLMLVLTLSALILSGCGGIDSTENTTVATEALTPVTVVEYVNPGSTMSCTGTGVTLYEDPAHPTPLLTATTLIKNTTLTSYYDTNTNTATAFITAAQWATDCAIVNTPGRNTKISTTYNKDVVGNKKTLTQPPTLTLL